VNTGLKGREHGLESDSKSSFPENSPKLGRMLTILPRGVFQLFLFGSAFAAWRALQSPSTFTLFILESTVAATVGIYFSAHRGPNPDSRATGSGRPAVNGSPRVDHVIAAPSLPQKRRRLLVPREEAAISETNEIGASARRTFLLLSISFFSVLAFAVSTLSGALYVAPLAFYAALGLAAGILAWNIYRCGESHSSGILIEIILLATLVKLYFLFLNPYVYASDAFLQFAGVRQIEASGHVSSELGHYYYFPGHAIFGYSAVAVTGIPLPLYGVFPLASQILLVATVYLIGREVATRTVGLFAAILTVFSVYTFLSTHDTPALYGLPFLVLAVLAVVKLNKERGKHWLTVFWLAALGTFFSHPINALVLGLVLFVRLVCFHLPSRRAPSGRVASIPALSYGVAFAAYLAFIAVFAFETFVLSLFATTYAPPLATSPTTSLRETTPYILQSAVAPLALALTIFFAAYGLLSTRNMIGVEHRFLVLVIVVFAMIPVIEVVAANFRAQSSRFLLYISIPLVLIGGHGVARMVRALPDARKTTAFLVVLVAVFGFLASSTYLTNNDVRFLNPDIPVVTTHITTSALASRDFLALAGEGSHVYMEFGSWFYFDATPRSPNALFGLDTHLLDSFDGRTEHAFVIMNYHFLPYGNPYNGSLYDAAAIRRILEDARASRLFDSGEVQVYLTP